MARKLIVEVIADPSQYIRGLDRASKATGTFSHNVERSGRGVASATIGLRGLGRAAAGISGYFVGGFAVAETLRSIADRGSEAIATQRQLEAQLRASGISFDDVGTRIEETLRPLSLLSGFTRDDLTQAFITLVRTTKNVGTALDATSLAADVARGRHISLAQASIALAKAESGNLTSLRRLGIEIPKNATKTEALAIVSQRYAGQAQAGATASQRFHAELANVEATIGENLLPSVNKLLGRFAVYLDRLQKSGKLARDAKTAGDDLAGAVEGIARAFGIAKGAVDKYRDSVARVAGRDSLFYKFFGGSLPGQVSDFSKRIHHLGVELGFVGDQGKYTTSIFAGLGLTVESAVGGMQAYISGLQEPTDVLATQHGVSAIPRPKPLTAKQVGRRNTYFDNLIGRLQGQVADAPTMAGQIAQLRTISSLLTKRIAVTLDVTRKLKLEGELLDTQAQIRGLRGQQTANAKAAAQAAAQRATAAREAVIAGLQLGVDRAAATKGLQDDLKAQQALIRGIEKQIAAVGRTTTLEEQLLAARTSLRDTQKQIAANEKAAAAAAKTRRQATLFERLGLTATGEARVAGVRTLQAELRQINAAAGEGLVTLSRTMRQRLATIASILKAGDPGRAVRQAIADILDPIREGTKKADADWTKFRSVNAKHFLALAGLTDLSAGQRRRVATIFAMAGPGFTLPGATTPAFAGQGGMHFHGDVNLYGVQDVARFENDLTKRAKQRPSRRRGA